MKHFNSKLFQKKIDCHNLARITGSGSCWTESTTTTHDGCGDSVTTTYDDMGVEVETCTITYMCA